MITSLLYNFLKQNVALKTALSATDTDSKIYYATAPQLSALPKIVFWPSSPENIGDTGVNFSQTFTLEIYAETKEKINEIYGILIDALNNFDGVQKDILQANNLRILSSEISSSFSSSNFDLDTQNFLLEAIGFRFNYIRCKGA
jgi:hypothetical protein